MTATEPIMAIGQWKNNAELIADCARLGYLRSEWRTYDATYGLGTFWKLWRPDSLLRGDINPKLPCVERIDFTSTGLPARSLDAVVFDPPYKLNGTPSEAVDARYGVQEPTDWRDRMILIQTGLSECARILGDGCLLVKCQDQVCSGKVRWQTNEIWEHAKFLGLGLVDRLDLLSYRPQPAGRRQVHARRNSSTLLVFKRGWGL